MTGHILYTAANCPYGSSAPHNAHDDGNCPICDGGLGLCSVCGAGEVELPMECPGVKMTQEQREGVGHGDFEFWQGKWYGLALVSATVSMPSRSIRVLVPAQFRMPPRTFRALAKSIEHWDRLRTGRRKMGESVGVADCALCLMFHDRAGGRCEGCPVKKKTGREGCLDTPWLAAHAAADFYGFASSQFRAAAEEEYAFLRSLLPPECVFYDKPLPEASEGTTHCHDGE